MKLPTNDRELNAIVFKNAGVSTPRSINDYFNLKQINEMLLNENDFSRATKDWLYNAADSEYKRIWY